MDAAFRIFYCLLFGVLAYLVRRILLNGLPIPEREVATALVVVAIIALISYAVSSLCALPRKSIFILLQFDFALIVLFLMQGFSIKQLRDRLGSQAEPNSFYDGFFGVAEQLRGTVVFIGVYLFQVVAIWSPVDFLS